MEPVKRTPTPSEIKYAIAVAAGCEPDELTESPKTQRLTIARFAWYRMLRKYTRMSYASIGHEANRDHSTIVYGANPKYTTPDRNERVDQIMACAESVLERIMSSGAVGAVVTKETVESLGKARRKDNT